MKLFSKTAFDFLGKRRYTLLLSFVLVTLSVGFLFVRAPRWGIDFTGGVLMHVQFESPAEVQDIRASLEEAGIEDPGIQELRDTGAFIIRVKQEYATEEGRRAMEEALSAGVESDGFEILQTDMVGPAVGAYIRDRAVMAFLLAFAGVIIYVAWRFKGGIWGFAAVLALIHDVIISFGVLNYLGITIDLPVVAALLTLAGYSVNDSIVVYDRIRENLKLHYKKPLKDVINMSINGTLSRTVVTSGTTFMVVLALYLQGGEVLRGFSTALLAGILVGTYSSIFLASPLVYIWYNRR